MKLGCWELQRNPEVPPTLLPFPFPHGTPPTTGPEKSHQFCPPLPHCERNTTVSYSGFLVCQDTLPHFSQAGFRQSWGQVCESQCLREGLRGAYAGICDFQFALWILGSPKVLRFYSRRSIPDLHKTNHSCAPNCLEIFLNQPIIGTKQADRLLSECP